MRSNSVAPYLQDTQRLYSRRLYANQNVGPIFSKALLPRGGSCLKPQVETGYPTSPIILNPLPTTDWQAPHYRTSISHRTVQWLLATQPAPHIFVYQKQIPSPHYKRTDILSLTYRPRKKARCMFAGGCRNCPSLPVTETESPEIPLP